MNGSPMLEPSDTLRALEGLALKRGMTLGRMSARDRLVVLAFASLSIPASTALSEAQVNQALRTWLAGDGEMLRIDHVELRRSLIDLGLWERDGYGRAYRREPLQAGHPAREHVAAMAEVDLHRLIADARAAHEARREKRRATFQGPAAD